MAGQRVVVVTGGLRGIGRAVVDAFCRLGDEVWAVDLAVANDSRVAQLPQGCNYLPLDVADTTQVVAQFATIGRPVDVLVNNAGITRDGLVVRTDDADWQAVMAVNLTGTYACTKAVLPLMMRQRSGCIINMSSVVASTGNPGQAAYAASKAGIEAFTRSIAREYGGRGIRANAIAPGFIMTPMTNKLSLEVQERAIARTSLGRAGHPEEIAELVLFLASEKAAYITAQIVHINGGIW